jgi:hypothetical protein
VATGFGGLRAHMHSSNYGQTEFAAGVPSKRSGLVIWFEWILTVALVVADAKMRTSMRTTVTSLGYV